MRRTPHILMLAALLLLPLLAACPKRTAQPRGGVSNELGIRPGYLAKDFELPDDQGQPVVLSTWRGTQPVLLAFYPKDFTGG